MPLLCTVMLCEVWVAWLYKGKGVCSVGGIPSDSLPLECFCFSNANETSSSCQTKLLLLFYSNISLVEKCRPVVDAECRILVLNMRMLGCDILKGNRGIWTLMAWFRIFLSFLFGHWQIQEIEFSLQNIWVYISSLFMIWNKVVLSGDRWDTTSKLVYQKCSVMAWFNLKGIK